MAQEKTFILSGEIKVDNKKSIDGVSALKDEVNKTAKGVENLEESSKKQTKETVKGADKSKKSVSGLNKATQTASKGFKGLGMAMKATGIGLIVGLVASLTGAFRENQVIMDAVNKVMTTVSVATGKVVNAISSAYNQVSQASNGFKSITAVIKGLITIALTPLKLTFFSLKLAIEQAQLIWEKSFFGDGDQETIKELNSAISETKNNIAETAIEAGKSGKAIIDNVGGAFNEMTDLVTTATKNVKESGVAMSGAIADNLVELRKEAMLAEAELERISLLNRRDAEIQRQRRDDIRLSIDERIKANEKLGQILEESLEAQKRQARTAIRLAKAELATDENNIQKQQELRRAKNQLLAVEEEIEGFRSEQQMNEAQLQQERKENLRELRMIGKSDLEREKIESQAKLERQKELINRTVSNEKEKLRLIRLAEQEHQERLKQMEQERKQKEQEKAIEELEKKREKDFQNAEAEFQFLKKQKQRVAEMEILTEEQKAKEIDKINGKITKAKEEKAEQEKKIANIKATAEYQEAAKMLKGIGTLIGKQAMANKAVAGAEALIDTYQGVTKVWKAESALPEPFATASKVVSTGTTLLSGLKAVQKIKSTNIPNTSGGSGGGGGGASGGASGIPTSSQGQAPDFNIIGQSTGNQVADAINNNNKSMKAYVVGKDVSNQQELDRNIEEPSRLG